MPRTADPVTTRVQVRLLGPPSIEVGGSPRGVDTRKAIALLAYLVVTGRAQSREVLADLFWPSYEPTKARAGLRRTLSVLNAALDGVGLDIGRGEVRVVPEELWVDATTFRALTAADEASRLTEALELYRGDFLAGFGLRDAPDFDDWQVACADEFRSHLARALDRLATWSAERGEMPQAIDLARRRVALDPLHEPAHRRLMELQARAGDRAAALRQYRECVAVLESELGVTPVAETNELYAALREGRVPDHPRAPVTVLPSPGAQMPIVGRDRELVQLVDAHAGGGTVVVVEGEAGIGKTRLVTELCHAVASRDAKVVTARCHQGEEGLAYGPVAELVRALVGSVDLPDDVLDEVSRLLPGTGPPAAPVRGADARTRFYEAILTVLERGLDGPVPGVAFVDDLQWADEASVRVLAYAARRMSGRRFVLVIASRPEGPVRAFPRGAAAVVHLGRLSRDDVAELAGRIGSPQDADRLYEESEGVPFYVATSLDGGDGDPDTRVRDAVEATLSGVSEVAIQVLTAAAVLGRSFDAATLRAAGGRSEEETVSAIEELVRLSLLVELGGGSYDFGHHKVRDVVVERTTPARRRLLHARVARALARRARRDRGLTAVVAHHFREAGQTAEAARSFRAAGDHARRLYANAEALGHYEDAIALGGEDVPELHEAVGDLLTLAGRYRPAIASYESAIALGAPAGPLEHKLGGVHHRLGAFEAAASFLDEAAVHAADEPLRARIDADRALNAHRAGLLEAAERFARAALAGAEAVDDRRALAQAHNILGMLASRRGDPVVARRHLEQSLSLAQRLDDLGARVAALNNLALAHRAEGNVGEALGCGERALELCARIGDRHREAALHSNLADILRDAGREDEAMEHLKRSAAIFAEVGEQEEPQAEVWKLVEW